MTLEDRTLTCRECGGSFLYTTAEQEQHRARGFERDPARCPGCRGQRRPAERGAREATEIACAGCGWVTEVPFRPVAGRPVYCRECYPARQ